MGKYDFQMDLGENSTTGKFAHMITPGSTVLEFGCAEGRMTRYMSEVLDCRVYIVEIDRQAYEQAMVYSAGGLCCDAETLEWRDTLKDIQFDYIMFSDVLEHLRWPDRVLKCAGTLLKEDGQVLVSIPNIGHGDVICSLLCNRFHYTDVGLLDNTHVHFWGRIDFIEFARECGFAVVEEDADYLGVNESEQAPFSNQLPNGIRNEIASFPYSGVYEFVFILRKYQWAKKERLGLVSRIKTDSLRAFNMVGLLYFDTGEGYSDQNMETITVNSDGYFSQRINLPPNCRSVRFDPMEGVTGCVWDVYACTQGKSLAIQTTNGYRLGRALLFRTTDSQIEFEPLEPNTPWIDLRALVKQFDGPAWVELCEQVLVREQENSAMKERLNQSLKESQQAAKNTEAVRDELNALIQAHNNIIQERDRLAQAYNDIEREGDKLAQSYNKVVEERDKLAQSYNKVVEERDKLAQSYNKVVEEWDKLAQSYNKVVEEGDKLAQSYNKVVEERDKLTQDYNNLVDKQDVLTQAYDALNGKHDALAQVYNALLSEHDTLNQTCDDLKREMESIRHAHDLLLQDRNALDLDRVQIARHRDEALAEIARLEQVNQKERQNSAQELAEQKERYLVLVNQYSELSLKLSNLQASYDAISDAQLWKMTAPVRKVLDACKQTRVGSLTHKAARYWRTEGFGALVKKIMEYNSNRGIEPKRLTSRSEQLALEEGDYTFDHFLAECETTGQIFGRELLDDSTGGERVLLVSHELSLTGAPIALVYFAENLKKYGMKPVFMSPRDGNLRDRACSEGIPVIVSADVYETDLVAKASSFFRLIVVSTIVGAPLICRLSGRRTPVLWWIHEAKVSYHPGALNAMPETVGDNIHVYCGGEYARRMLAQHRPAYESDVLLYTSQDFGNNTGDVKEFQLSAGEGRMVFLLIGTLEERKGQDVLVEAIRRLDPDKRRQSYFVFVGPQYYEPHYKKIKALCEEYPDAVEYITQVDLAELPALYQRVDCVICASRDDPMPIVMADAMSLSKLIICSENSGTAPLIEQMSSGLVYRNNDPADLARCIERVLDHSVDLKALRQRARQTYESFFSREAFDASFTRIMQKLLDEDEVLPGKISVVIPVYNGGTDLKRLLQAIDTQVGVEAIEVVIVDSGSTDGSAEYAQKAGANVIRIPQSEFSHSYARNLGEKHATGDYVLFMTQDACPNGPLWMRGMLKPVLERNVVAVSCQELPRQECDLLGRVSIYNHSRYMGILDHDRILEMPQRMDNDSLRKNAQLNDVSCLVQRDVFERYHYRRNYAEDLDLGLRLIRDGHKLALLSSVCVIHSHTRPSMYHFKRGIVDVSTINDVLPGTVTGSCPEKYVLNRILTAYCVLKRYVSAAAARGLEGEGEEAWRSFCEWTIEEFNADLRSVKGMSGKKRKALIAREDARFDPNYRNVMLEMLEISGGRFDIEPTTVIEIRNYIIGILGDYFSYHRIKFDATVKEEICVLAEKLTGLCGGNLVGSFAALHGDEDSGLNSLVKKYSTGV